MQVSINKTTNTMDKKEQQQSPYSRTPGMKYVIDLLNDVIDKTGDQAKNTEADKMMRAILEILTREKWIEEWHIIKAHHIGMMTEYKRSWLRRTFFRPPHIDESVHYFETTFKTKVTW
jgi:hypothetical protein